jgi:hypothetical protein
MVVGRASDSLMPLSFNPSAATFFSKYRWLFKIGFVLPKRGHQTLVLIVTRLPYFLPYRVVYYRIEILRSFTNRKNGRPHGNRTMIHLKTP